MTVPKAGLVICHTGDKRHVQQTTHQTVFLDCVRRPTSAFFSLDVLTLHGDYEETVSPPMMTGPYPENPPPPSTPRLEDDCLLKFPYREFSFSRKTTLNPLTSRNTSSAITPV